MVDLRALPSTADNTRRTYTWALSKWRAWCSEEFLPDHVDPTRPDRMASTVSQTPLLAFVRRLAADGVSPSTMRVCLSALADAHQKAGLRNPTKTADVRRLVRAHARQAAIERRAQPVGQVAPLDREALDRILDHVGEPPRRSILSRDVALVQTMRDGLLRRSEAAALDWQDLTRALDGSGRLLVHRSKTDQTGEGRVAWLSPPTVDVLARWTPPAERREAAPIFCHVRNGRREWRRRLSGHSIATRISRLAADAGLDGRFSGHSPRVGMSQDLTEAGASLLEIMRAGGWTSPDMPARYTRQLEAQRGAVAHYWETTRPEPPENPWAGFGSL